MAEAVALVAGGIGRGAHPPLRQQRRLPGLVVAPAIARLRGDRAVLARARASRAADQCAAFKRAVEHFIADLGEGQFRAGLRVKGIVGMPGCFEMTWVPDGRAIFTYGKEVRPGEPHVIWLAVEGRKCRFPLGCRASRSMAKLDATC